MDAQREELLRRLALNDDGAIGSALGAEARGDQPSGLDLKTHALVRLAALVATESAPASYEWGVAGALTAGATEDEIIALLPALAPVVGLARVNWAAPGLALALGYDLGMSDA